MAMPLPTPPTVWAIAPTTRAEHAGDRKSADASGSTTGRVSTHPPPALEPEQQANAERQSEA